MDVDFYSIPLASMELAFHYGFLRPLNKNQIELSEVSQVSG